jgi:hypothetical protein
VVAGAPAQSADPPNDLGIRTLHGGFWVGRVDGQAFQRAGTALLRRPLARLRFLFPATQPAAGAVACCALTVTNANPARRRISTRMPMPVRRYSTVKIFIHRAAGELND